MTRRVESPICLREGCELCSLHGIKDKPTLHYEIKIYTTEIC